MSLAQVLEAAGYDLNNSYEDAMWLLSKQTEFEELVEKANDLLEEGQE